jgi:hypothetical protein
MLASCPVSTVNQNTPDSGIPTDSAQSHPALVPTWLGRPLPLVSPSHTPDEPLRRTCQTKLLTRTGLAALAGIAAIDGRGTNYNPGYARNKRIQASVYFSWPLAAKCWPS